MRRSLIALSAALLLASCAGRPLERVVGTPAGQLTPKETLLEDTAPKAELRMVPPEVYMRTYLQLFGGLLPSEVQQKARAGDGNNVFDTWDDYVSALGFPDYRLDIPRQTQTNALMIASFERLGVALCDRAVEHDLMGIKPAPPPPPPRPPAAGAPTMMGAPPMGAPHPPPATTAPAAPAPRATPQPPAVTPVEARVIFAFEVVPGAMDEAQFAPRFDVLHRTFLGYPASLAPPGRAPRYLALYRDIAATHKQSLPKSRFSPEHAAWAAVCYGLVRHPEFHLY